MLFNIEMLLTAVCYGRSNFYNIDYSWLPEDEDEEHEEAEEDGDVVHRPEHDHQLPPEVREKPDQLEDPEKPEGPENGKAGTLVGNAVHKALVDLERTENKHLSLDSFESSWGRQACINHRDPKLIE